MNRGMAPGLARRPAAPGRAWLAAWLGAAVVGVANGVARGALYERRVGARAAHGISTATLLGLLGGYMWIVARRWPLPSRRAALLVGSAWTAMTVAFEFGFGRLVAGESWAQLLEQYDVRRGNAWLAVPLWMLGGPAVVRALQARRARARLSLFG